MARAVLAFVVLAHRFGSASGYGAGYDSCDRNWPSHGTNLPDAAFRLSLTSGGNAASSWLSGSTYTVTLDSPSGTSTFRGFIAASFQGTSSSVTSFTATQAGSLGVVSGDANVRAMRYCSGGVTQSGATDKTSVSFTWTPPAAGTGTVTIWAAIVVAYTGNNYNVKLEIPEAAPSPGASYVPPPSATPSRVPKTVCELAYVSRTPAPSATPTYQYNTTLNTVFDKDGWGGHVKLGSINLSWRLLGATQEIAFTAWIAQYVWMGFTFATKNQMLYPATSVATIGTPADGGVSNLIMNSYVASTGMHPVPNFNRAATVSYTNTSGSGGRRVYNTSMYWTRPLNSWVCEDRIIDPNAVQGMVYAWGVGPAFADHGGNTGFARLKLINVTYVPPSATPTPSNTPTPTGTPSNSPTPSVTPSNTPSVTPTASITPSPSPSTVVGGGGGSDPLAGSVTVDDISLSWHVNNVTQTVAFSVSAVGRVWLSLARATSQSMIAPAAGVAVCGLPPTSGTGTGTVSMYLMNGYAVSAFTSVPTGASSGLSGAVIAFDGVRTTLNFTRTYGQLGGATAGDLALAPTLAQGFIYARGYLNGDFTAHEKRGYKVLRLEQPSDGLPPSPDPTPSITPSPTPSAVVAGGGGTDPLAGSVIMDDVSMSWRVDTTAQTVAFSLTAAGRVWLSLARATSLSMIAPAAGVAVCGLPPASGTGTGTVSMYLMNGYAVSAFTSVPTGASSGLSGAVISYDGAHTTLNFTRTFGQLGGSSAGDLALTPTLAQGFIYARGYLNGGFDAHENRGYKVLRLQQPADGASPSADPTPSITPSPTPSAVVAGGGGSDPLSGSVTMDDLSLSWHVDPTGRTVDYSLSAAGRVWLSLGRATKLSMITPDAGVVVVGIPPVTGTGQGGASSIALYTMAGYLLNTFTNIPVAGSGVTNALIAFDGVRTTLNFTRVYGTLGGASSGDLSMDPTTAQGYIYARGYLNGDFTAHEKRGYKVLRLQQPGSGGGPVTCDNSQCNWHGQCQTAGSALCVCDTGYVGDACDTCDPLYARTDLGGGNFTCALRAHNVRATVQLQADAQTSSVGTAGSAARIAAEARLHGVLAQAVNLTSDEASARLAVNITDRVLLARRLPVMDSRGAGRRQMAGHVTDLYEPAGADHSSGRALSGSLAVIVTVTVEPSSDPTQPTAPGVVNDILTAMRDPNSAVYSAVSNLGVHVNATAARSVTPHLEAAAAASKCDLAGSSCTFPFKTSLGRNMGMAWRVDSVSELLHVQLAFTGPSEADKRWFGIAFSPSTAMVGGDAIAVEPGKPTGQEINRYILFGKTMSTCPGTGDDGVVLAAYSSFKTYQGAIAGSIPAVDALQTAPVAGSYTIVATFTRQLSPNFDLAAQGSRSIDPLAETVVTYAWGPNGAQTLSSHTTAMSGAVRLNMATGQTVKTMDIPLTVVIIHAALCLAGVAILVPLSVFASSCGRAVAVAHDGPQGDGPYAWWRRAHKQATTAALILTVAGFSVGVWMTPGDMAWSTAHGKAGVGVMAVLALATAVLKAPRALVDAVLPCLSSSADKGLCSKARKSKRTSIVSVTNKAAGMPGLHSNSFDGEVVNGAVGDKTGPQGAEDRSHDLYTFLAAPLLALVPLSTVTGLQDEHAGLAGFAVVAALALAVVLWAVWQACRSSYAVAKASRPVKLAAGQGKSLDGMPAPMTLSAHKGMGVGRDATGASPTKGAYTESGEPLSPVAVDAGMLVASPGGLPPLGPQVRRTQGKSRAGVPVGSHHRQWCPSA